jgi:transposase InsO family protein
VNLSIQPCPLVGLVHNYTHLRHLANSQVLFTVPIPDKSCVVWSLSETRDSTIILQSTIKNRSFKITLNNVCYIPMQDGSLLSLSRLDKQGGGSFIHHGCVLILDEHLNTVVIGNAIGNQYLMNVQTIYPENIHTAHEKLSWNQWHTRYGHISFSGLQRTHQMGLVNNFSVDTTTIPSDCSACTKAKLTRTPHTNASSIKTTSPGDLTHTDLCTTTDHGVRYFLTCIDDYSRYVTIYSLKHKDEAMKKITEYLTMLHTQFRCMPKALRADNGKEYVNQTLRNWCNERGIQLQSTAPYTSQQNGVAECVTTWYGLLHYANLIRRTGPICFLFQPT